jgi:Na+/proline symporter
MPEMFWPVAVFIAASLSVGLYTYTQVRGSSVRYTVCGKSMPFLVIGTALLAQAVDGNATLGNTSLTHSSGVWAGAVIPIGLAVSLFLVGRFLAEPLHRMNLLTLPEFFYRRYDKNTELLVSLLTIACFTVLIAGNLAAVGWILSVVTGLSYGASLAIMTAVIVSYTIAGGLYSAIWTDFVQIHVALIGFVGAAVWLLATRGLDTIISAVPPETINLSGLLNPESGALLNWANLVALGLGNMMALDFMERVFAAKSPATARRACYYAGGLTLVIGLCASVIGLAAIPALREMSDSRMVLPVFASSSLPYWIGVMVFIGVLGASMSTANGAMLVISIVLARNVIQRWSKREFEDHRMLALSRWLALPTAAAAAWAAYVRPEPGILLVVAFDIVFAGCVAPLLLGVYWRKANAAAAISAIVVGTTCRLIAHLVTPEQWAGLDTLIPPVISGVTFWTVCQLTWKRYPSPANVLAVEASPVSGD